MNLRLPTLLDLSTFICSLLRLAHLHLYPILGPHDLTLQVKTAPLLGIIRVKHLLEALGDLFEICAASFGRFHIEDLAGF